MAMWIMTSYFCGFFTAKPWLHRWYTGIFWTTNPDHKKTLDMDTKKTHRIAAYNACNLYLFLSMNIGISEKNMWRTCEEHVTHKKFVKGQPS